MTEIGRAPKSNLLVCNFFLRILVIDGMSLILSWYHGLLLTHYSNFLKVVMKNMDHL